MGRPPKNTPDDLDKLLLDAQHIQIDKDTPAASLPNIPISKRIMEFAQFFGALKYRDMRKMLSILTKCRKLESDFFKIATPKLPFEPVNWTFSFINGHRGIDPPRFVPETFEREKGLIPRIDEMRHLLAIDQEVRQAYDAFEKCWYNIETLNYSLSNWIHEQFRNGTIEKKIKSFKDKIENKKKIKMSKGLVSNLIEPSKTEVIRKTGEPPDLSVGERQALQFLLGKIDSMTEREKYLKTRLLDGEEECPKTHGYFVVFEMTEVLRKSYGDIEFSGYHYGNLEKSLLDLLEKKRHLLIETEKDRIEFSAPLLQKLEFKHQYHHEKEWKNYVAVRIPFDVAKLHDKKYTYFPDNHFALLRNTPPKTLLDKTELRFFDFLRNEAPHKPGETKIVRRKKDAFLDLIGGPEHEDNRNKVRLAHRIEQSYLPKAEHPNMKLLRSWTLEINADGEEVYVFEFEDKQDAKDSS
jgi:hypothetical protein